LKAGLLAGAGALTVLLALLLLRASGPAPASRAVEPPPSRPPAAAPVVPETGMPWPDRNPFRYADEGGGRVSPAPPLASIPPPLQPVPAPAASASPLRLIGLVRKGGAVKAALSLWGETVVLGVGEEARGYRLLSVDEESGARLRSPDGTEVRLAPSPL